MTPNPKFNLYDYDSLYDDYAWANCFAAAQNQETAKASL